MDLDTGPCPVFDPHEWPGFEKFIIVQAILDHNKLLINEINLNHERRRPEGLTRNVQLIRELNENVTKVMKLYEELSQAFVQSFGKNAGQPAKS
ncbi:hypothetical protein KFL_001840080 [Klebsormidium nitens]|uniref:Protein EARLY FLOWERING 4 domain-containing protein n=1 Tax=Klebsormidium nitens TaxID=105231 RepID=A0A1Y1I4F3_KLENI|nr:hypothetical protein KFL_001840080 [Klebsormidium nitens]|eukprot:GAQ84309.1 hypothetical protein KFL_001840080 [Klebsormidium nitens]